MLGTQELLIVLVIALVIFGGSQLPKLARSIGEAQKEFRKGSEDAASGRGTESDGRGTESDGRGTESDGRGTGNKDGGSERSS